MMNLRLNVLLAGIFLVLGMFSFAIAEDAFGRLTEKKLKAVHADLERCRGLLRPLERTGSYKEFRANLHVHSKFSHDSRGEIEEIVEAAKKAGSQILMFTEHPAEHYDFFKDGHSGLRDGVLMIPGAEMDGMLVYPHESLKGVQSTSPQAFSDLVRSGGGLTFVSHLEERMDWELNGLCGNEIYNTHADFKDERRLLSQFRNPLWLLGAADLINRYPQEAYSALQHYPADYLKRWDELCQQYPHTGVSANDAHQNVGVVAKLTDQKKVRIEDASGEKLLELDSALVMPLLPAERRSQEPNSILLKIQLDPYEQSLRHVGTHLLMTELSEPAVWDALNVGRAYVAFDWIADSRGFDAAIVERDRRHELGSQIALSEGLQLLVRSPLEANLKLIRDGELVTEKVASELEVPISESGVYRVEAWLEVAGEKYAWVLTNPFYVGQEKAK